MYSVSWQHRMHLCDWISILLCKHEQLEGLPASTKWGETEERQAKRSFHSQTWRKDAVYFTQPYPLYFNDNILYRFNCYNVSKPMTDKTIVKIALYLLLYRMRPNPQIPCSFLENFTDTLHSKVRLFILSSLFGLFASLYRAI